MFGKGMFVHPLRGQGGPMSYTERQVQRGRRLVASLSKAKWGLGDLALEVVPATVDLRTLDYVTSPERTELQEFADAIGLQYRSLLEYRLTAAAFPAEK